jgi:hypothetical protein
MQDQLTTHWFIPQMEEFQSQRALLNLRLGKATRYYRELVVPGIGGVWFVRQLSWAVAGIKLGGQYHLKPTKVANAVEALACKLEWQNNRDEYNMRGKRAFERDENDNVWSFKALSDRTHYVQVTYRQSAVRGLSGLEFATGTRYNTMELSNAGNELSEVFLKASGSRIANLLTAWFDGASMSKTEWMTSSVGSKGVNENEKRVLGERLHAASSDKLGDPQRRRLLIEAFGANRVNMPSLSSIKRRLPEDHVNNINTAMAFDAMLECGRSVIHKCAQLIADKKDPTVSRLVQNQLMSHSLKKLTGAAVKFQQMQGMKHNDATAFADEILSPSIGNEERLANIVLRDKHILDLSNKRVTEGHLFDRRKELGGDASASEEEVGLEESSTENKLRQLFRLWGDCR